MNLPKKIGYNTLCQLFGKFVSALSTFLILALVARRFGEAGTGEFTLILSYTALFYLISDFGLNAIVVKKMVAEKKKSAFYFQNLLGLRIVFSLFLIVVAVLTSRFLPYSRTFKLGVILTSLTILTQSIFTTANAFFQSRLRYDLSVLASSLGSLVTVSLVFLLLQTSFSLLNLLLAYPIGGIAMAVISLFVISAKGGPALGGHYLQLTIRPAFDFRFWRALLLATLPLSLTLIVDLLHFRIDTFLLAYFRPITEVGTYNLAYKVFENILVFPVFFVNSVYPFLIENHTQGVQKLRAIIKKSLFFLIAVSVLGSLFLVFFSPLVIRLLAGGGFSNSVLTLRILSFSLPAFFATALLMWVLITLGKQWLLFRIYFIAMILDLVLNLIFIPKYGFLAAAVTTGATEGLVLILEGFFVWKFLSPKYRTSDPFVNLRKKYGYPFSGIDFTKEIRKMRDKRWNLSS